MTPGDRASGGAGAPPGALHVLHVISGLGVGGTETVLARLLPGLRALGVHATVIALRDGALRAAVAGGADGRVAVGARAAARWVARQLVGGGGTGPRPDVVQGWLVHGNVAALAIGRVLGRPVVWGVRSALSDLEHEPRATRRLLALSARVARRPARILYNSARAAEQHEEIGYPRAARAVVPNGFDTDAFRPDPAARAAVRAELGIGADAPVVGMVARRHPQKDHDTFLRAAARLHAERPDAVFVLVGAGADAEGLGRDADAAGLAGAVRLLGRRADVARLVAAFDVATLTSRTEAFPNALGEAMAAGVPCVATDVGDVAHLVGDTGVVVAPGDDRALAAGWAAVLGRPPALRDAARRAARARVVAQFSARTMVARYAALYREIAGACGGGATTAGSAAGAPR